MSSVMLYVAWYGLTQWPLVLLLDGFSRSLRDYVVRTGDLSKLDTMERVIRNFVIATWVPILRELLFLGWISVTLYGAALGLIDFVRHGGGGVS